MSLDLKKIRRIDYMRFLIVVVFFFSALKRKKKLFIFKGKFIDGRG